MEILAEITVVILDHDLTPWAVGVAGIAAVAVLTSEQRQAVKSGVVALAVGAVIVALLCVAADLAGR